VAALVSSIQANGQPPSAASTFIPTQNQYGKTERTWTFAEPQSASHSRGEVESKNEASAAAATAEKFRKGTLRD
jgi:hypothetical protein